MPYDALIFDLDGTLWNTLPVCCQAWNAAIQRAPVDVPPISAARLGSLMGLAEQELRAAAFPGLPDELRDAVVRACFAEEQRLLAQTSAEPLLYPGVAAGLAQLAELMPLHVVSNCQVRYMEAFLANSAVGRHIRDWECFGRTGRSKGDNLAAVVARNGHTRPLFVGDTEGDEQAAQAAGAAFIHAGYGFGSASPNCPRVDDFPSLVALVQAQHPLSS